MAGFQTTMQSARKNITDLQAQLAKGDKDAIQAEIDQLRKDLAELQALLSFAEIDRKAAKGMRSTGEKIGKHKEKD